MRIWFLSLTLVLTSSIAQEVEPALVVTTVPVAEERRLFINGATALPENSAAFTTSRGEVWLLDNATTISDRYQDFNWRRFASGLRHPKRIVGHKDGFIIAQHQETTRINDTDKDGTADLFWAVTPTDLPSLSPSPFQEYHWLQQPETQGIFAGQYFGGSKEEASLARRAHVHLPDGSHHQSLFNFHNRLTYPVDAIIRLPDNSWLIAQSNRRQPDRGRIRSLLQQASWNDDVPPLFEVYSIQSTTTGIELHFTQPLLEGAAEEDWAYQVEHHPDTKPIAIEQVAISDDRTTVSLTLEKPLEPSQFYQISADGVWSQNREPVRNPRALFIFER